MFEGILQPTHLIIILVIVLIFFGPGKLPELGKSLGQSIRELRNSDLRPSSFGDAQPGTKQPDEQLRTDN